MLLPALAAVPLAVAVLLPTTPAAAAGPVGGDRLTGTDVVVGAPADPVPPAVSATSYVVADADTGEVLAAKDPHGRYAPASTLKVLTALAVMPRLDPAQLVTPAADDVNVDGSKVGLVTSLAYPVSDLLTAMLVVSGNDAAGALATAVGGQQAAAGLMNAEAARLQALDTTAVNTSGLDAAGQLSSAYDLALLGRAGLALPEFRRYVATNRAKIPAPGGTTIEILNHNRLLREYEGALGVKNGYTSAARASFIGAAARDGRTLVVALMRADPSVWREAGLLLDWGFQAVGRDAEPIGRLVDPLAPAAAGAELAEPSAADGPAVAGASVPAGAPDGTSTAWPVGLGAGLLLTLGVLRRRAVVKARRRARRRRALAAAGHLHPRPADLAAARAQRRTSSRRAFSE